VLFGTAASSVVLNPFFAGGSAERANNEDVVAGTGPHSALYLWRRSANVSERVDPGPGLAFDAVTALTGHGATDTTHRLDSRDQSCSHRRRVNATH